jgi:hypothetical protein
MKKNDELKALITYLMKNQKNGKAEFDDIGLIQSKDILLQLSDINATYGVIGDVLYCDYSTSTEIPSQFKDHKLRIEFCFISFILFSKVEIKKGKLKVVFHNDIIPYLQRLSSPTRDSIWSVFFDGMQKDYEEEMLKGCENA